MNVPRIQPFEYRNAEAFFFRFSLIFYLLLAIPFVPFIIIYLSMQEGNITPALGEEYNLAVTLLLAVLAFSNVVMGMRLYRKEMQAYEKGWSLREKFNLFFHASIVQFSCLEAALLIAVAGLYLTKTVFFILLFLGMLIIMAQVRPDMRRLSKELRLTKEEEEVVYQKKEME